MKATWEDTVVAQSNETMARARCHPGSWRKDCPPQCAINSAKFYWIYT